MVMVDVRNYKKSIRDMRLPMEVESIIWDFYVTRSISKSANLSRRVSDYNLTNLPLKEMLILANISDNYCKVLLSNTINATLKNYNLDIGTDKNPVQIDIITPRIICSTPFSIADEEPPKENFGKAESILTHIRNSFAHSNTYFFDNGNILLEDKDSRGRITSRMVFHIDTLIKWIQIIDHSKLFYDVDELLAENNVL